MTRRIVLGTGEIVSCQLGPPLGNPIIGGRNSHPATAVGERDQRPHFPITIRYPNVAPEPNLQKLRFHKTWGRGTLPHRNFQTLKPKPRDLTPKI